MARAGGLPFLDGRDARRGRARGARTGRGAGLGALRAAFRRARRLDRDHSEDAAGPARLSRRRRLPRLLERPRHGRAGSGPLAVALSRRAGRRAWPCWRSRAPTSPTLRRRILAGARGTLRPRRCRLTASCAGRCCVIFDRTFAVTRALEGIAVAVAVLGIANALAASAVERRRSFGLLRAIGASGEQIRRAHAARSGADGVDAERRRPSAPEPRSRWLLLAVINPQSFGWTVALAVPWVRARRRHRPRPRRLVSGRDRPRADRRRGGSGGRRCRRSEMRLPAAACRCSCWRPRRPGADPVPARPRRARGRGARVVVLDRAPRGRGGRALRLPAHVLPAAGPAPRALRVVRSSREAGSSSTRRRTSLCRGSPAPRRRSSTCSTRTGRRARRTACNTSRVRTAVGELTLTLHPAKPPVLHGEGGISKKGPGANEYSRYVSITRLTATGTLRRAGGREPRP